MKALSNKLNFWTQLIIGFLLTAILIAIPTGYEGALIYTESVKCKAEVISTDESSIISTGLIPVSYTHLDVYKRQVIRPAILWNDGRTDKETDYLNNVIAVSYTHLMFRHLILYSAYP